MANVPFWKDIESNENYINAPVEDKLTILDEVESYLLETANMSNTGYVSEDGVVERWVGGVDNKFVKDIKKYTNKTRKKFEKELNDTERVKRTN
jgi:hypothetical protein